VKWSFSRKAAEAFAQDEFGVGDIEAAVKGCAEGVLQAVFGPEGLRAVRGLNRLEWLLVVRGGEGDVLGGVPVLSENDVVELLREGVDKGDNLIAFGDSQGSAGHEVVLDVNDEECVVGLWGHRHGILIVLLERVYFSSKKCIDSPTLYRAMRTSFRGWCDGRYLEAG